MEEAAEKALALIEHAGKYLSEAEKEQSNKDAVIPYDANKDDKKESYRAKRQSSVPQTSSDAAKGGSRSKRAGSPKFILTKTLRVRLFMGNGVVTS
jgi:hypothetical protein